MLQHCALLPFLRCFDISSELLLDSHLGEQGIRALGASVTQLANLETLKISECGENEAADAVFGKQLAACSRLTQLSIMGSPYALQVVSQLHDLPSLRHRELSYDAHPSHVANSCEMIQQLSKLTVLQVLKIRNLHEPFFWGPMMSSDTIREMRHIWPHSLPYRSSS